MKCFFSPTPHLFAPYFCYVSVPYYRLLCLHTFLFFPYPLELNFGGFSLFFFFFFFFFCKMRRFGSNVLFLLIPIPMLSIY